MQKHCDRVECIEGNQAFYACTSESCDEPATMCKKQGCSCKHKSIGCKAWKSKVSNIIETFREMSMENKDRLRNPVIEWFDEIIKIVTVAKEDYLEETESQNQFYLGQEQNDLFGDLINGPVSNVTASRLSKALKQITQADNEQISRRIETSLDKAKDSIQDILNIIHDSSINFNKKNLILPHRFDFKSTPNIKVSSQCKTIENLKNKQHIAVLSQSLSSYHKIQGFQFYINNINNDMDHTRSTIGICYRDVQTSQILDVYHIFDEKRRIAFGDDLNKQPLFSLNSCDTIRLDYDPINMKVLFFINSSNDYYSIKLKPPYQSAPYLYIALEQKNVQITFNGAIEE